MSWPRLPEKLRRNRAVTPFFRAFGGYLRVPPGDAVRMSSGEGLHRTERMFLSLFVPLMMGAITLDMLWRLSGPWLAWIGVVPGTFLLLHGLAFALGGRTPGLQWGRWEMAISFWAVWQLWFSGGTGVGIFLLLWGLFLLLNLTGVLVLVWRVFMSRPPFLSTNFRWFLGVVLHAPAFWLAGKWGWPGLFIGLLPLAILWGLGTFLPNARLFGPMVSRVEGKGPLLTIDDGPDPEDTPAILDLLDAHAVKAVFFVIGEKVAAHPDLAREIVRRGHELGNHTMTHPAGTFWCAGSLRTRREIAGCSRVIAEVTGQAPRWFRAPVGHRNWFTHPVCHELGMEVVAWKRRAFDTVRADVPGIVRCLTKGAKEGDILLLHESTPVAKEVLAGVLSGLSSK
jgi:peptidoglycan/xylan/chitin deacetylase (PgdA/CDA1 family)